MVRRGWPPAYLEALTVEEYQFQLENAVAAAKEEAEAMKRAAKSG